MLFDSFLYSMICFSTATGDCNVCFWCLSLLATVTFAMSDDVEDHNTGTEVAVPPAWRRRRAHPGYHAQGRRRSAPTRSSNTCEASTQGTRFKIKHRLHGSSAINGANCRRSTWCSVSWRRSRWQFACVTRVRAASSPPPSTSPYVSETLRSAASAPHPRPR